MAGPPTGFSVVAQSDGSVDMTWTNQEAYSSMAIHRKVSGGSYADIGAGISYPDESYTDDSSLSSDTTYYWKVVTNVGDSDADSCTLWTASPSVDTSSTSDSYILELDAGGEEEITATDVVYMLDGYKLQLVEDEPEEYEVDESEEIILTDYYSASIMGGQDWQYIISLDRGKPEFVDNSYTSDDGYDIASYYQTKALDFSEQYPQYIDAWKTISAVYLDYVDLNEYAVVVSISTDNGASWTHRDKFVGSGDLRVKTERFDFWESGRFFIIKLSHSSSDKAFQWVRMKVEFEPHVDWFGNS